MKVNKYVYNCNRCGKDVGYPPLYTVDVYNKYDESLLGKEYHFCEDCYKEIDILMKDKNQVTIPFSVVKDYIKKLIDNAPEKQYVPVPEKQYVPIYYPVHEPRDWWDSRYPKVTCTTTTTDGTSISTNRNTNNVTACCCDSERRI